MMKCKSFIEFIGDEYKIFACSKKFDHVGWHEAKLNSSGDGDPEAVTWLDGQMRFRVEKPAVIDGEPSFLFPAYIVNATRINGT